MDVQVVDLFNGCGGMSQGFAQAQCDAVTFELAGAMDTDRHANATYARMLGVEPLEMDVRELTTTQGLDAAVHTWGLDPQKRLVLIGCAPCQGFSSHRKKDRRADSRNGLLEAFAAVVAALRPAMVVMENVPEMLGTRHWPHYLLWKDTLEQSGYTIRTQIHNLAGFGVPQERFRVLALAMRDEQQFKMPQPSLDPRGYKTVRQAIGSLPALAAGETDQSDPMHVTSNHRMSTVDLLRQIPPNGGSRSDLPEGVGPSCLQRVDGFRDVYGRLYWDKPAVAITARCRTPSCGRFAHPEQHRGLSVREAALLQGFPNSYMFEGPFDDKFKQIGNAVSPPFAEAVAQHVASLLSGVGIEAEDRSTDITEPLAKSFSSSIASLKRAALRAVA
jgi:DNA (cytosine-5)-methyltransferase 1